MSITLLPDPGPLSPMELLTLTPKEAALLETLRGLFTAIHVGDAVDGGGAEITGWIRPEDHHHFLTARNVYLELRIRNKT